MVTTHIGGAMAAISRFSDAEGKSEISVDEVTIDALGHTAEKVAGQAPTYTSAGWKDYWKCSVCQKLLKKKAAPPKSPIWKA